VTEPKKFCTTRKIKLTGELGRKFGRIHNLAVDSTAEAIQALCVLYKGFREELQNAHMRGVQYRVLVGKHTVSPENARAELSMQHSMGVDFTISPVLVGSKRDGALQTIVGAVLIIVGAVLTYYGQGWIGQPMIKVGVAMVAGGIVQMLSPMPGTNQPDEANETKKPNTQFSGPVNTSAQGNPVPICYGELAIGSAVISAGLSAGIPS
jgi:predicted phage tail protein